MSPTLLILAGGIGSRYGSFKQIDKIGPSGERIIDYSVYDAIRSGFQKIVYVIHKDLEEEFKEVILNNLPSNIEVDYVCQELTNVPNNIQFNKDRKKPWGTGHALLVAQSKIKEPFAVINADDFYGLNAFKIASSLLQQLGNQSLTYALVGYKLKNTLSAYGSVSRAICEVDKNNFIISIVDRIKVKIINDEIYFEDDNGTLVLLHPDDITSMNFFTFTPDIFQLLNRFFIQFVKQNANDIKIEFGLPTVINNIIESKLATLKAINTDESWFGLTYKEDRPIARNKINALIEKNLYPLKLWD